MINVFFLLIYLLFEICLTEEAKQVELINMCTTTLTRGVQLGIFAEKIGSFFLSKNWVFFNTNDVPNHVFYHSTSFKFQLQGCLVRTLLF
jgi:hypothetical protein